MLASLFSVNIYDSIQNPKGARVNSLASSIDVVVKGQPGTSMVPPADRRLRPTPASSSLPLQTLLYYNVQYAVMYIITILVTHVYKVCTPSPVPVVTVSTESLFGQGGVAHICCCTLTAPQALTP